MEEGVGSKFFPLIVTKVPPPIEPFWGDMLSAYIIKSKSFETSPLSSWAYPHPFLIIIRSYFPALAP